MGGKARTVCVSATTQSLPLPSPAPSGAVGVGGVINKAASSRAGSPESQFNKSVGLKKDKPGYMGHCFPGDL